MGSLWCVTCLVFVCDLCCISYIQGLFNLYLCYSGGWMSIRKMKVGPQIHDAENIDEKELQTYVNELNRELKEKQIAQNEKIKIM